ncbi:MULTISPECIES: TonB-dependent receptor domain-containing protein [Halomonas]|uniref:TonB-dependent receptor n=1 Tax=Halomonas halophila TaxID=29573 RepID=A0ABQ0TZI7_9GAMM|nr:MULTISPECIES: TonB-dependent receptor [Halomonas]MDR5889721.1 TonB-dependent receptor [Halomonas salina]RAH38861.1 TonB-dependent receptor [Halomonas sp. SL1]WJY06401.1 TonB-dependent receptor [Halomonas halophila]GEK71510.1 TonB-dependent receptor [Halomonas halophila]
MNKPYPSRGLAFALAALPLAVQAQGEAADDAAAETLNPLVVTAALAPRTADESLASVTVIDEDQLRRQDPTDITDALRAQPGVDVTSSGGFGKTTSVYLRGTGSESTPLMIDGIRLRSATAGGPAWQFLEPRMFERVEIVRGPRGSLYGADAVGGVVQLFTPEGEGEPAPRITLGGGSFDTRRASASLSGSEGGTRYYVAASRLESDGYEIVDGEGDKGYDNTTGLMRLSHTFAGGAELGVLALRARGNTEFDAFGTPADTDYVQQVAGVYGELPITETWSSRLTLSEARDKQATPLYGSVFDTQAQTARWENTLDLGPHQLVVGGEYREEEVNDSETGSGAFSVESRDNTAVFTQALMDFSPLTVQASLRHDDNEAYGEETTGSLALGVALDDIHTLRASYGTAFRAPTFNDLYYPFDGFFVGNPDLDPETSETYELGIRGQLGRGFWDLAVYQSDIDDLITNVDSDGDGFVDTTDNVDRARIRGVEVATGADVEDWTLRAALTYVDPENRETGKRLQHRASRSLRFDADRALGDWTLGGSVIAQDHRYADEANEQRLGGFATLDLRAGWNFAPGWSTRLTLENLLDKQYQTVGGYNSPGRAAFVSVSFGG